MVGTIAYRSFMKNLLIIGTLLFSFNLFAHGDHGHSHAPAPMGKAVSKKRLPKIAKVYVMNYIQRGALDKTWNDAVHVKSEKKSFNGKEEWILSFKNSKSKDKKKQVLYVFMRLDGKLIAANFTGK